ncbi:hypothetical protein AHF37_09674 [Paragonimus kellicotti]|nr:hypothetical protein AHF37_09674 [Paragonimus kellicotti]
MNGATKKSILLVSKNTSYLQLPHETSMWKPRTHVTNSAYGTFFPLNTRLLQESNESI